MERGSDSAAGELFQRVADLDFMLRSGIPVMAEEINCEEFVALRILDRERIQAQKDRDEKAGRHHPAPNAKSFD